jgi:protein-S-isoprenylcysteine O-methyltransferase Ste14
MPAFSSITFCLSLLLVSYLSDRCFTPPNPHPQPSKRWKRDRYGPLADPRQVVVVLYRAVSLGLYLHHAGLALTLSLAGPSTEKIHLVCHYPQNLNSGLFTWTPYTAVCLFLIICVGAPLRLAAYDGLGKNFTYLLAPPDRLITTGIYHYMQHPSYTGLIIVIWANLLLFNRWDGSVACWVPPSITTSVRGLGFVVFGVVFVLSAWTISFSVSDEEAMLGEKFGEDWERWHRSTKRFIPGVF